MARELLGIEPIEISGGHFPMVENPKALATLLDRLARDHGVRSDSGLGRGRPGTIALGLA
jgi:hypothetical protein